MKKIIFLAVFTVGLTLGACRNNQSHEGHENHSDHQHAPGDTTHQGHGTPADTMHHEHEHAPGDTTHQH